MPKTKEEIAVRVSHSNQLLKEFVALLHGKYKDACTIHCLELDAQGILTSLIWTNQLKHPYSEAYKICWLECQPFNQNDYSCHVLLAVNNGGHITILACCLVIKGSRSLVYIYGQFAKHVLSPLGSVFCKVSTIFTNIYTNEWSKGTYISQEISVLPEAIRSKVTEFCRGLEVEHNTKETIEATLLDLIDEANDEAINERVCVLEALLDSIALTGYGFQGSDIKSLFLLCKHFYATKQQEATGSGGLLEVPTTALATFVKMLAPSGHIKSYWKTNFSEFLASRLIEDERLQCLLRFMEKIS